MNKLKKSIVDKLKKAKDWEIPYYPYEEEENKAGGD